ncbi:MAG: rubrerythrin family protein [Elusimicrobiales bacterium]|nr:rubrerythrin family protein [Elusimicrobiales bacterium]
MKKLAIGLLFAAGRVSPRGLCAQSPKALPHSAMHAAAQGTLDNLMAAFSAESNSREEALAWAKKADEEGYKKAAQLFRAVAKSEEIHAGFHAGVIKSLGGKPVPEMKTPVVKSTRENLERALQNETMSAEKLYPGFVEQAKADNVKEARMAFGSAIKIYSGRKPLYEAAIKNLKAWKKASRGFMVCTVCGELVEHINFMKCPVCGAAAGKFIRVR